MITFALKALARQHIMIQSEARKICVVLNNRANYGRIKPVLACIKSHDQLTLQLVAAASTLLHRFGPPINIIRADGFEPNATLHIHIEGDTPLTMAKSAGVALIEYSSAFNQLEPHAVVVIGDRYETLAAAIAARYMNICLAHVQGGEISGSIDDSVRHAISKLATIHFPATQRAAGYLQRMGEDPSHIFLTGCPSIDCGLSRCPRFVHI